MRRTLFIGDVHGCLEELKELLHKVAYDEREDRLIYLGDILNKGPNSSGVLKFIYNQNVECVLGNNEVGFLDLIERGGYPGSTLRAVKDQLGEDLDVYCKWIQSFPLYIEEEDFIAVHAGISPYDKPSDCSKKVLTTIRTWDGVGVNLNRESDPPWYTLYDGVKTIIYGHYAAKGLQVHEKTIGLDSGCVFGGKLTCLEWPSRVITQVQAKKMYLTPSLKLNK